MDVALASAAVLAVAVTLLTLSDLVALPVSVLLASWTLSVDRPLLQAAAIGTAGVVAGRLLLARQGRQAAGRPEPQRGERARPNREQLHAFLASSPRYAGLTFGIALLPIGVARTVFPLLGELRLPLRYALAGTVVGQLPVLLVGTWLFREIAQALAADDRSAAMLLALGSLAWLVVTIPGRLDRDQWRRNRRLAARPRDGFAWTFGMANLPGPGAHPPGLDSDDGDDVIEGRSVAGTDATLEPGEEPPVDPPA